MDVTKAAKALHNRWAVGDSTCNNGVLLLLLIRERDLYISTGKGTYMANEEIGN